MRNVVLLSAFILLLPCTAQAQFFFRKATPKVPAQRVPELVAIVRGDPEERKRTSAAEELREYDIKTYPEIVTTLAEAAMHDAKNSVRAEAVSSLSRIRPVSSTAGQAIEYAAASDPH